VSATISVSRAAGGDLSAFDVVLREGASETRHRITLTAPDAARLSGGAAEEKLVEAAFRFLLDREPKESILSHFDLSVISRYFPEFEQRLPDYLD
jgi:hypothetical protein